MLNKCSCNAIYILKNSHLMDFISLIPQHSCGRRCRRRRCRHRHRVFNNTRNGQTYCWQFAKCAHAFNACEPESITQCVRHSYTRPLHKEIQMKHLTKRLYVADEWAAAPQMLIQKKAQIYFRKIECAQ